MGVELRCDRLEVWVLVKEPGGLGVFVHVSLAEGEVFVRVEFDEVMGSEGLASAWWEFACGRGGVRWVVGEGGLVAKGTLQEPVGGVGLAWAADLATPEAVELGCVNCVTVHGHVDHMGAG
jgi:hypothetical protein